MRKKAQGFKAFNTLSTAEGGSIRLPRPKGGLPFLMGSTIGRQGAAGRSKTPPGNRQKPVISFTSVPLADFPS